MSEKDSIIQDSLEKESGETVKLQLHSQTVEYRKGGPTAASPQIRWGTAKLREEKFSQAG